jgi:hypothetical protein
MSAEREAKSHATAWAASIGAVLFLYVGTWPFIDARCGTWRHMGSLSMYERPRWAETFYYPLHYLSSFNGRKNPLAYYNLWCCDLDNQWRSRLPWKGWR